MRAAQKRVGGATDPRHQAILHGAPISYSENIARSRGQQSHRAYRKAGLAQDKNALWPQAVAELSPSEHLELDFPLREEQLKTRARFVRRGCHVGQARPDENFEKRVALISKRDHRPDVEAVQKAEIEPRSRRHKRKTR